MASVKTGIDIIGHEMNILTASLSNYRKQKTLSGEARTLNNALLDIRIDSEKAREKDLRIRSRIEEISDRLGQLNKELENLSADTSMEEIKKKKAALWEQERKRDELTRAYTTLSMTASHVFRKAEKIATKQRHPSEVAALQRVMDLLSDHSVPEPGDLVSALTTACPIAERMIGAGEIVLKNKEERGIFSDPGTFCSDMRTACSDVRNQDAECRNIQDALSSHPVRVKMNALEREKIQL